MPEWEANTTTNNAKWLIGKVMLYETAAISSTIDTDGDGVSDLQESIDASYPFVPYVTPGIDKNIGNSNIIIEGNRISID